MQQTTVLRIFDKHNATLLTKFINTTNQTSRI